MRIGLNLVHYGRIAGPAALDTACSDAARWGLDFVTVSDHVAVTDDVRSLYPEPFLEQFTTVAWLAGRHTDLDIGTSVTILPYRHPLLLARTVATLDALTDGRFFLGVGVGWARAEFEAIGASWPSRGSVSDEILEILVAEQTASDLTYEGRHASFPRIWTGHPENRPRTPIWVGGTSVPALRRAARFGDAWHPENAPIDWIITIGLPTVQRLAKAAGRPTTPTFAPRISVVPTGSRATDADRRLGTGSEEQIVDDLARLRDLGASHVLLDPYRGADEGGSMVDPRVLEGIVERHLRRAAA